MDTLAPFIESIRTSSRSSFFRELWTEAHEFSELPLLTRDDVRKTPLSKRRYVEGSGLTKIVHTPNGPFLSEWTFADIAGEPWAARSERPMVYLSNPYEAIEKAMWCRSHGMVPLIGEKIPEVARLSASAYRIDSLIADEDTLAHMLPHLSDREALDSITVIGSRFDVNRLFAYARFARSIRLVLALPETGALSEASLAHDPIFTAVPNVVVENRDGELIATKGSMLVTPVIRYRSGILISEIDKSGFRLKG